MDGNRHCHIFRLGDSASIIIENHELNGFIGIWSALGVTFGLAVGSAIEAKNKKEGKIRPLTEEEMKRKKLAVTVGLIILLIGAMIGLLIFLALLK